MSSPIDALGGLAVELYGRESERLASSLARLFPKLGAHLERAGGVADIRLVTPRHVSVWVDAPLAGGRRPSEATRHYRRAAARLAFGLLRDAGVVGHDPAADVRLPPRREDRISRPLTDEEVRVGRAAALVTLDETRRPAVWALAEATATPSELPRVLPQHVDLRAGTVLLLGNSRVEPREAPLTVWGARVLERRLGSTGGTDEPVVCEGSGQSAASLRTSAVAALVRVLTDAGLRSDPTVKAGSVRAWAGHRVFSETGRIQDPRWRWDAKPSTPRRRSSVSTGETTNDTSWAL